MPFVDSHFGVLHGRAAPAAVLQVLCLALPAAMLQVLCLGLPAVALQLLCLARQALSFEEICPAITMPNELHAGHDRTYMRSFR